MSKKTHKDRPSQIKLTMSQDAANVLMRCLSYGESCISKEEWDSGVAEKIHANIAFMRRDLANAMAESHISQMAD